jgi:hypothetical protein
MNKSTNEQIGKSSESAKQQISQHLPHPRAWGSEWPWLIYMHIDPPICQFVDLQDLLICRFARFANLQILR